MTERQVRQLFLRCARFLNGFTGCFGRRAQRQGAERYLRGLLGPQKRKVMLQIANSSRADRDYQALHHFITDSPWPSEKVWRRLRRSAPPGPGLLVLDDTGFKKQGQDSVGVARQYSGTLGKVGNCQIAVAAGWVRGSWRWPLGMELYLPEEWADDPYRRERAEVPPATKFREKWRLGLQLVDQVRRDGLAIEAVVADADYGRVSALRRGLRKRGLRYMLSVPETTTVWPQEGVDREAFSVAEWAVLLPRRAWKMVRWREGTKGPLRAEFAAIRVRAGSNGPANPVEWLLCERSLTRTPQHRYYLSTLPPNTSRRELAAVAHGRWHIERLFQDLKDEVSLDHFAGRTWPGWHHHVALAALAFAMLEKERHRRGADPSTFPFLRRLLGAAVFLLMLAEDNEQATLLLALHRNPPHWGFG